MTRLHDQISHHFREIDDAQQAIEWEEIVERVHADTTIEVIPDRRPYRRLVGIGAVALLLVLVGVVGVLTGPTESETAETISPPTTVPSTTPVTGDGPTPLEETLIAIPDDVQMLSGTTKHRGGPSRTGVLDVEGVRSVDGYYWTFDTGSAIFAPPVSWGQTLFVGTSESNADGSLDGTLYGLNQNTGELAWPAISLENPVGVAPAVGMLDFGEGPLRPIIAVVDGAVYVATHTGYIYAFDLLSGSLLWVYPENPEAGDGLGTVRADLTYADGFLYVGTEEGVLHVLAVSARDGVHVCERPLGEGIVVSPIVSDTAVFVPTLGQQVFTVPPGACEGSVEYRQPFYFSESPVDVSPAEHGGVLYIPSGQFLNALRLSTAESTSFSGAYLWTPSEVAGDAKITAPPVIAGDTLYYGDEAGTVYAIDAISGEHLWTWRTSSPIRVAPVVVNGAVFIVSSDGIVYAVGEGTPVAEGS